MITDDELLIRVDKTDEPNVLRRLLNICEQRIKTLTGSHPTRIFLDYAKKEVVDKLCVLLKIRKMALNKMFLWNQNEVSMIGKTNALLLDLTKRMYDRTSDLYRTVLRNHKETYFEDDYNVEGRLLVTSTYDTKDGDYGTIHHFKSDGYYGSDFAYMIAAIANCEEVCNTTHHDILSCQIIHKGTNTPGMSNKELDCDYRSLDDGESWLMPFDASALNHLCVCHALYSLCVHHRYSLPDIIRINSFTVESQIICQHITDSNHRRYKEIRNAQ